jgi:hypothetical protein
VKKVKIKRTNRGAVPISNPAGGGRPKRGVESTSATERAEQTDRVSLSQDALAVAGVDAAAKADADGAGGPLPDPRATSQAIIEKELATVFKEIYL